MMPSFLETSKQIANEFLQSIVFIDDKAYCHNEEKDNRDFEAFSISKIFAEKKKICAIYRPRTEADIMLLASIAAKADITILDWQIFLDEKPVPHGREEDDEENVDPRGPYTLSIIREILSDNVNREGSLKLIIVYTGETTLEDIAQTIHENLTANHIQGLERNFCTVSRPNVRILVIAKPESITDKEGAAKSKFHHLPKYNDLVKSYEQLPDLILDEFTKMTNGLLSNVALKALTEIRKNCFKLIRAFTQSLDPAFLAHRALLNNPEDSEEQIIDLIGSEIKSILKGYNSHYYISTEILKEYIDAYIKDEKFKLDFLDKEKLPSVELPEEVDRNLIFKFTEKGIERILLKKDTPFLERVYFSNTCHKSLTRYYTQDDILSERSNKNYAILTSVKSSYNRTTEPLLTQGTILKKKDNTYWLCLQPKCDSIRIENNRDFLLTPLKPVIDGNNFDVILYIDGQYQHFAVNYSIFKAQFFKFKANRNQAVRGILENGKIVIKGETPMEWIAELKNDFAQSVSNNFAANISRVGMDQSEWLRRSN